MKKMILFSKPIPGVQIVNMIVRHVKVNRRRSPKEVLNATGRVQFTSDDVVAEMPKGEGEETDVFFLKLKLDRCIISNDDLEKVFEFCELKSADTYSQAAVNEADSAFADVYPNCTHWKNANGKWCLFAFNRSGGKRFVHVYQHDHGLYAYLLFAGVRK